ncbi:MAG: hypothetical protein OEW71_03270 [Candidatus Bathyarchaeota archaeon]|nr:hypothetical protein [Candidatus Bathyarchaeota archaeon]
MRDKKVFLASFIVLGFVMKIIAEFVHEVCGHGLFVLLFGGEITSVHISVLWPYELSSIKLPPPNIFTSTQWAWIYGGGILACLCVSFLAQAFLILKKKISWYFAITLFWLAFWTLINSTGYFIIGGLLPFGDIRELIRLGVLTAFPSLVMGFIMFVIGFVALSWILRKTLIGMFHPEKASLGVTLFWLIIPVLGAVMLASPERNFQVAYFPLMFIPSLLSFILEYFLVLSKQKAYADPDNVAEE